MININLLPEEYRRKKIDFGKVFKKYNVLVLPIAGISAIVVVVSLLVIIVYPGFQKRTLKKLETQWKAVEKDYEEVTALKKEQKKVKELVEFIDKMAASRILWARTLNNISDCLPAEIQLTEMFTKIEVSKAEPSKDKSDKPDKVDKPVLIISGIVPSYPGERAIGDFVRALGANSEFVKGFPEIEPPSTETMADGFKKFTLKCYMPPVPKEPAIKEPKNKIEEQKT